ncbi:type II/IV secretion system ATPase subunit [Candidatus Woesearchaeota archaeon]|nr:type II/IV secretion system ATPase subunit [Candidatus Woesearchaeota archaeon]
MPDSAANKDIEFSIDRVGEETILRADFTNSPHIPSIEDNDFTMSRVLEKMAGSSGITKIVFFQKREYEYDYQQTLLLEEIAKIYAHLTREKERFSVSGLSFGKCQRLAQAWYTQLKDVISNLLLKDPLGAFVELRRIKRRETILLDKSTSENSRFCLTKYIEVLDYLINILDNTKLVILARPHLAGYDLEDRSVYRRIFNPTIKPDFMYTKLMAAYPKNGEEIDSYTIGEDTEVTVFKLRDNVQTLFHINPPEFKLSEEKYELLDTARNIMAEHKPKRSDFVDPRRMRDVFLNVGKDLIEELATYRKIPLREKDVEELTQILVRYTVGFGLIEVLLQDENIQDISINSPMGRIPIFIVHGSHDDCFTNIIPTPQEAESWASKLRMISGRPLDEANPILDTELELPGASTRVSAINPPLNPTGLAFSFRRHRDKPWTLPLFIKYRMINPLAAGLISFLVDGTRTMMVCGTRSSGKSSFLSSIIVEIMRRFRIITIEDTLELPVPQLRDLGFNIQSMKVASSLTQTGSEVDASIGIRATLRLGDSSLIVGEVRSKEAIALYEAMRVGAAANVVAGTIHADSPYGLYDRVVNDIGVPKTSFKATDIILVATPIKSADGLHKYRRVTQITEVQKTWEEDPLLENGFLDLMKYDAQKDELVPTLDLINGESEVLKTIAGKIADFAGNWDAVWQDILARAKYKETLVKKAIELKDDDMLEAPFVILCNDMYHICNETVKKKTGKLDHEQIYKEWETWFEQELKRRKLRKQS